MSSAKHHDRHTTAPIVPIFADIKGAVQRAYRLGADKKTTLFVLSPNLRVLASLFLEDAFDRRSPATKNRQRGVAQRDVGVGPAP